MLVSPGARAQTKSAGYVSEVDGVRLVRRPGAKGEQALSDHAAMVVTLEPTALGVPASV
jgi:hypothetical protein